MIFFFPLYLVFFPFEMETVNHLYNEKNEHEERRESRIYDFGPGWLITLIIQGVLEEEQIEGGHGRPAECSRRHSQ